MLGLMDKISQKGSLQLVTENAEKTKKRFHHYVEDKTVSETVLAAANQSQEKMNWQSIFFESMEQQSMQPLNKEKPIDRLSIAADLLIKNANRCNGYK
jgi:hypothetical protein